LELDSFDLAAFQLEFDFGFHFVSDGESVRAYVFEVLKWARRGGG
jgi:hypothetical protein